MPSVLPLHGSGKRCRKEYESWVALKTDVSSPLLMGKTRFNDNISSCKFLVNRSFEFVYCLSFFMKPGSHQGLLLTEQSPSSMSVGKTTQKAFVIKGRLVTRAITINLVKNVWIFLCPSIGFLYHTYKP